MTGRDVEEKNYAMKFEKEKWKWKFTDEVVVSQPQQDKMSVMIVELINNNNGTMELKDISSDLIKNGYNENTIRWRLSELVKKKILSRDGRGVYKTTQQTNNPTKLNNTNILNKHTYINNDVGLLDATSSTSTLISDEVKEDGSCLNVCLLDSSINERSNKSSDSHQGSELITDNETNLEDTDIIEDVSNLLTPYICRKNCIHYEPIGPSEIMPDREFKEFCKLSNYVPSHGFVCQKYKNKDQSEDSDGCLIFN
jgi:hypothetical protein